MSGDPETPDTARAASLEPEVLSRASAGQSRIADLGLRTVALCPLDLPCSEGTVTVCVAAAGARTRGMSECSIPAVGQQHPGASVLLGMGCTAAPRCLWLRSFLCIEIDRGVGVHLAPPAVLRESPACPCPGVEALLSSVASFARQQ